MYEIFFHVQGILDGIKITFWPINVICSEQIKKFIVSTKIDSELFVLDYAETPVLKNPTGASTI